MTHSITIWVSFETDEPACHEWCATENAAICNTAYEIFGSVDPEKIQRATLVEYENGQPVHCANVKDDLVSMMAEHTEAAARQAALDAEHRKIESLFVQGAR